MSEKSQSKSLAKLPKYRIGDIVEWFPVDKPGGQTLINQVDEKADDKKYAGGHYYNGLVLNPDGSLQAAGTVNDDEILGLVASVSPEVTEQINNRFQSEFLEQRDIELPPVTPMSKEEIEAFLLQEFGIETDVEQQ